MSSHQPTSLRFLPPRNPVHRVNTEILGDLCAAQQNSLEACFPSAAELLRLAVEQTRIAVPVPEELTDQPAADLCERPFKELYQFCRGISRASGIGADEVIHLNAVNLAQRIHLLRAFSDPDRAVAFVRTKILEVVEGFPRAAEDIQVGRNPGDVLDPYVLTATQYLLYEGDFGGSIGATVAHKALMMIEGLLGHLHEDILGQFRGNVRSPEPRGFHQELLDLQTNPFPGADVIQPPTGPGGMLRFHQVKSKTGSAKGGDAKRLGEQLRRLQEYYGGATFYDALIGNTLRGHRSMRGVLRASPQTVVLVGAAAFRELTGSRIGSELLMRVYQNAFSEAARSTGYSVTAMARSIVDVFRRRAEASGDDYLDLLLQGAVHGDAAQQDSRLFGSQGAQQPSQ